MKTLFNQTDTNEILQRIDQLTTGSQKQWGTMNVSQMLAHCAVGMEVAMGKENPPRVFIGRILGPLFKKKFYNDEPFQKNSPTAKIFMISDSREFEKERTNLKRLVQLFTDGGPAKCTSHPHAFFGKLTAEQWGIGIYKHLDHHLRQFGA